MPPLITLSVILFTIAMVFYTWGVWAEHRAGVLEPQHLRIFWLGIILDILATIAVYKGVGGLVLTPHAIIGFVSLLLMLLHGLSGLWVLHSGDRAAARRFNKSSLIVWSVWMLSYLSGFVSGLMKVL